MKGGAYSRLKTLEILLLLLIAPSLWVTHRSEEYFFVVIVGDSLEIKDNISS